MTDRSMDSPGTVFVTGATSPVGLRVVERLGEKGWSVCCLVRSAASERILFNYGTTSIIRGSCHEFPAWESSLRGVSTLLHLAPVSLAQGPLEAAKRQGVQRFISLSSTRGLSGIPDALGESVRHSERLIGESCLDYTILQSTMIYGSRKDANVERLARWIDRHRWIPLIDGGRARIQPVFFEDVAEAIVLSLERAETTRRSRLIVAGAESLSWREMVETLGAVMQKRIHVIPVSRDLALPMTRLLGGMSNRVRDMTGLIERMNEDRVYSIQETIDALGEWRPISFREGAERTYGALGWK